MLTSPLDRPLMFDILQQQQKSNKKIISKINLKDETF